MDVVQVRLCLRLVHDEANEWTSAGQIREYLTTDALLHGNGYALVTRSGAGRPIELHRLDPASVTCTAEADGTPIYKVRTDAGERLFPYSDILHIQPFGGVSPIVLGRDPGGDLAHSH